MKRLFLACMVLALFSGCAMPNGPRFTPEDFSSDIEKVLPERDFAFHSLQGMKVYVDVTYASGGDFTWQTYYFISDYVDKEVFVKSECLKDKMIAILKQNGAEVVATPSAADYAVSVEISKLKAVVEEASEDSNQSYMVPFAPQEGHTRHNVHYGVLLEAKCAINGVPSRDFRKIVSLHIKHDFTQLTTYLIFGGQIDSENNMEFDAKYVDGVPVANGVIVRKQAVTQALFIIVPKNDWAGLITIYNPRTSLVSKKISFDSAEDWNTWTGEVRDKMKATAQSYYSEPKGYAVITAYDLMEYVFEEIINAKEGKQ
ncbi:MAG: hypothetical protein AB7E47_02105 [Desulfovibrionaceae bacterium]